MILLMCGIFKKATKEFIYKTNRVTDEKINLLLLMGKEKRDKLKTGIDTYILLYIE